MDPVTRGKKRTPAMANKGLGLWDRIKKSFRNPLPEIPGGDKPMGPLANIQALAKRSGVRDDVFRSKPGDSPAVSMLRAGRDLVDTPLRITGQLFNENVVNPVFGAVSSALPDGIKSPSEAVSAPVPATGTAKEGPAGTVAARPGNPFFTNIPGEAKRRGLKPIDGMDGFFSNKPRGSLSSGIGAERAADMAMAAVGDSGFSAGPALTAPNSGNYADDVARDRAILAARRQQDPGVTPDYADIMAGVPDSGSPIARILASREAQGRAVDLYNREQNRYDDQIRAEMLPFEKMLARSKAGLADQEMTLKQKALDSGISPENLLGIDSEEQKMLSTATERVAMVMPRIIEMVGVDAAPMYAQSLISSMLQAWRADKSGFDLDYVPAKAEEKYFFKPDVPATDAALVPRKRK